MITPDSLPLNQTQIHSQSSNIAPRNLSVAGSKIERLAKTVFHYLLGCVMFATNPTLFSICTIGGAIWDEKAQKIIEKIHAIWMKQKWNVIFLAAIGAFLAIQVTWAVGSIYFAMNLGKSLAQTE